MKKMPTVSPEIAKKIKVEIAELDNAIYSCVCPHCGAKPREQCRAKSKKLVFTEHVASPTPHMARVRAGHVLLKGSK